MSYAPSPGSGTGVKWNDERKRRGLTLLEFHRPRWLKRADSLAHELLSGLLIYFHPYLMDYLIRPNLDGQSEIEIHRLGPRSALRMEDPGDSPLRNEEQVLTDLCKIAQDRGRDLHWARPKPIPGELVRRIRKRVLRAGPIQAMGNFKRLFCVYCQAFGDNHDRLSHFTRNIENGLTQKLPEFGQGVGGGTQGRELVRFCPPSDRLICRHEVDRSAGQVHV